MERQWIFEPDFIPGEYLTTSKKSVINEFRDVFCEMTGVKIAPKDLNKAMEFLRESLPHENELSREALDRAAEKLLAEHREWTLDIGPITIEDYVFSFKRLLMNGAAWIEDTEFFNIKEENEEISRVLHMFCYLPTTESPAGKAMYPRILKRRPRKRYGVDHIMEWRQAAYVTRDFLARKDEAFVNMLFYVCDKYYDELYERMSRHTSFNPMTKEEFFNALAKLMRYFQEEYGFGYRPIEKYIKGEK